jgi:hypothetical protein
VLPSGFERLAGEFPAARALADGWLSGAAAGLHGRADDDRIFCHWMADYAGAHAARAERERRGTGGPAWSPPVGRTSFPGCHLHVVREGPLHLVVGTSKGATFRAFSGARLLHSDTGLVGVTRDGRRIVTHTIDTAAPVAWTEHGLTVSGRFHAARRRLATPLRQVAFRLLTATVGRAFPDLVRKLLQRVLITGRHPVPYRFERSLAWSREGTIEVRDRVFRDPGAPPLARLFLSTDATSIYVATSNLWQDALREGWVEDEAMARELEAQGVAERLRSWP